MDDCTICLEEENIKKFEEFKEWLEWHKQQKMLAIAQKMGVNYNE